MLCESQSTMKKGRWFGKTPAGRNDPSAEQQRSAALIITAATRISSPDSHSARAARRQDAGTPSPDQPEPAYIAETDALPATPSLLPGERPNFASPSDYVAHVAAHQLQGSRRFFEPATVAELKAAVDAFPHLAPFLLPPPSTLELMGLPRWFGRVQPFGDLFKERLVTSIQDDDDFRLALLAALRGPNEH
jgi:hypothetical protein